MAGGDGGQVLVDPTNFNFVYGTYFGISNSLYRFTDGGAAFFSNQFIQNGINLQDRSEFYVPWVLNPNNPNQLLVGSYRIYRTDDARGSAKVEPDQSGSDHRLHGHGAERRADLLRSRRSGSAAAPQSGPARSTRTSGSARTPRSRPTRPGRKSTPRRTSLPNRPVSDIAVDRSNYRIAYLAYNGYDEATPKQPGHAFKTTDGGQTWTNITGNLPNAPLNSLVLDPSYPNTLYAGTDVGAFITHDGGAHWALLGSGFPKVAIWQLDADWQHGLMAAGTHGRGAYSLGETHSAPALVLSKVDAGIPVGPSSQLQYTITLRNIGNAGATGVTITDPVPANTSFVSASNGGSNSNGTVTWSGLSIPSGGACR